MQLIDLEYKTDLIERAIKDGMETVEEYSVWLTGYTSGYKDGQIDALDSIRGITDEMSIL